MTLDDATKLAGILLPLGALILAFIESRKWRRELIGKNQMELAQKVGLLAVTFRNRFIDATAPSFNPLLSEDREHDETEENWETALLDEEYARRKLMERLSETLVELKRANVEAEILFDKDLSKFLETYENSAIKVSFHIRRYFELQKQHQNTTNETLLTRMEKSENVISGQDKDLINQVCDTTTELKLFAKTYLR